MIHSISLKNFYSFAERSQLDFVVNENAPKNNGYFTTPSGNRLSKAEVVIGPNASGKTNLLKVLPFFKWLILGSFNLDPQAPLPVSPFMFDGYKDKPSELRAVFEISGGIYTYEFRIVPARIISESLSLTSVVNTKNSSKTLFSRQWNEVEKKYDFDAGDFDLPKEFENLLRLNASVIGVAMRLNHKRSQQIAEFWQKLESDVAENGWMGDHVLPTANLNLFQAINFFSENETLKKEAETMLSKFDLGLEGFQIEKEKNDQGLTLKVQAGHIFGTQKMYLPFHYESSGTQRLFVLLKHILQVLNNGGIAVLDEMDSSLHPDMVIALLDLFINPATNEKNAQLLFSTHSHRVLSKLDKYQIVLTEKDENGISDAWRLDDLGSSVRADDNYFTKYMAGAYGAVPNIW